MGENRKPSYILDASFALAFLIPDEEKSKVNQIFAQFSSGLCNFYSTPLFPYEVCNGLRMAFLRKRLKLNQAAKLAKIFLEWDIHYESVLSIPVLELAMKKKLTVYDASYAWLAREMNMPILSFDRALVK